MYQKLLSAALLTLSFDAVASLCGDLAPGSDPDFGYFVSLTQNTSIRAAWVRGVGCIIGRQTEIKLRNAIQAAASTNGCSQIPERVDKILEKLQKATTVSPLQKAKSVWVETFSEPDSLQSLDDVSISIPENKYILVPLRVPEEAAGSVTFNKSGEVDYRNDGQPGDILGMICMRIRCDFNRDEQIFHMLDTLASFITLGFRNASYMNEYEQIIENVDCHVFVCDATTGQATYINQTTADFYGVNKSEILKFGWTKYLHPDDAAGVFSMWNQSLNTKSHYRWVFAKIKPVDDGGIIWYGVVTDITEKKRSEEERVNHMEVEASERKYRLLAQTVPHIVVTCTRDGTLLFANQGWTQLTGMDLESSLGMQWKNAVHPDDAALLGNFVEGFFGQIVEDGHAKMEIRIGSVSGEYKWHIFRAVTCEDSEGMKVLGALTDIDDQKKLEIKLKDVSEAKSRFLANMSHELRTPLSSICGMSQFLSETSLAPDQQDFVQTIRYSSHALLTVVNDILELNNIEAGQLKLNSEPFVLHELIDETFDLISGTMGEKDIVLSYTFANDVPFNIVADRNRLRQILVNSKTGGEVYVDINLTGPNKLHFAVHDTGVGFDPSKKDLLFTPFSQIDNSMTRKFEGSGLGLAICKHIANEMGGSVDCNSQLGKGSTFEFSIEFTQTNPSNNLSKELLRLGVKAVYSADTNDAAVSLLQTHASPNIKTRVICVSSQFFEASSLIESLETIAKEKSIVNFGTLPWLIDTGSRKLFSRPIKLKTALMAVSGSCEKIVSVLEMEMGSESDAALAARPTADVPNKTVTKKKPKYARLVPEDKKIHVLVADDNPVNLKVLNQFLKNVGLTGIMANDGQEAFEMYQSKPHQEFSLILTDLFMVTCRYSFLMDGFGSVKSMREYDSARGLGDFKFPAVLITANVMGDIQTQCSSNGIEHYISKPIDFDKLYSIISSILISTLPPLPKPLVS
ncbi:hypothetical protein BC829DRAFT_391601 [Chytridium lagenaria]|nr:hypothetical protein BC829DRAFT_391601 [Chytridium lagenaria]